MDKISIMDFEEMFPKVTIDFGYWFSGFVDGEGCFSITTYPHGARYRCELGISQRADDTDLLAMIRDVLGMGKIYQDIIHHINPIASFRIARKSDAQKLTCLFDKYPLRSKKQRDYAVWQQAVIELNKPKQYRNDDFLEQCFHQIRQVRKYDSTPAVINITINNPQLTFAL